MTESFKRVLNCIDISLLEIKGVQTVAGTHDDVLPAIQHVGLRRIGGIRRQTGAPQRLPGPWIVGNEITRAVVPKQQVSGRTQQALGAAGGRTLPDHVSGFVVDGA